MKTSGSHLTILRFRNELSIFSGYQHGDAVSFWNNCFEKCMDCCANDDIDVPEMEILQKNKNKQPIKTVKNPASNPVTHLAAE